MKFSLLHSKHGVTQVVLVAATVLALLGLLAQSLSRALPDVAFPLWAADRMLHGARLYVDILEINPPLFIWLDLPLAWLSHVTGLGSITWYRIATSLLLFSSLAGCWWALEQGLADEEPAYRRLLWLTAAFALVLLPRLDWGEREHLSLALTLPYILLGIARARSCPVGRRGAVLAGVAAAIGIALKPQFVLVWVGRELGARWRGRGHDPDRAAGLDREPHAETIVVPLVCIGYLCSVIIIHPGYFHLVRQLGWAYTTYQRNPLWMTLLLGDGSPVVLAVFVLALSLRIVPHQAAVWRVVAWSTAGFLLAAVLQMKEWWYHFYPALGLAMLLCAAMAWDARVPAARWAFRLLQVLPSAILATAVATCAVLAGLQIAQPLDPRYESDLSVGALVPLVRSRAAGRPLFAISPTMSSGFPLTNYAGNIWSQRLPHIWPAVVAYDSALQEAGPVEMRPLAQASQLERMAVKWTTEDFVRAQAPLVISLIPVDKPGWQMQRLDMIQFLRRSPAFESAWADYDSLGRVGNYYVWARRGDTLADKPLPVREPSNGSERSGSEGAVSPDMIAMMSFLLVTCWLFLRAGRMTRTRSCA
jgi:hypothetical protein